MAKGKKDTAEALVNVIQSEGQPVKTAPAMPSVEELVEMNRKLMDQVQQLTTSLAINALAQKQHEDIGEPNIRVENVSSMAIAFTVHDPRTGQPVNVHFDRRGAHRNLYRRQVEELIENSPHYFENGYLSAPAVTPDSANAIRDPKAFLDSCTFDNAAERVGQLTSPSTLFTLFNTIETMRWKHNDENGKPLTETVDGKEVPTLAEVSLPPNYLAVHMAVQRRIAALGNVSARMDG